ncbi:unnamed protein product [Lactuca saligna]|uniref:Uncharacterized protein n=1 Tax=Lactuca saligna TaxID=75948 RepID=A0AA35YC72_LACSI|nr:unnamed protein product [Lactuca saligna]
MPLSEKMYLLSTFGLNPKTTIAATSLPPPPPYSCCHHCCHHQHPTDAVTTLTTTILQVNTTLIFLSSCSSPLKIFHFETTNGQLPMDVPNTECLKNDVKDV